MKKSFKKLLITSLILFLLGIVMCSAALIYAAVSDINLFEDSQSTPADNYSIKISEVDKTGSLPLSKLYIHGEDIDVTICRTDEESYIAFNTPDKIKTTCVIENGVLKITDTVPFYILGLSITDSKPKFTGFRNVFTSGFYSTTDKSVTVYLNDSVSLDSVEVDIGIGTTVISDIATDNISVSSVNGDIKLTNNRIAEKATMRASNGDITLNGCSYAFTDIATTSGNIDVHSFGRKTNCESTIGNICVMAADDPFAYSIRATTSSGKIIVDDTIQMGEEFDNEISDAENTIWIKTIRGNISIYNSVTNE